MERVMSSFPIDDDQRALRCIGVTVRTPAGASSAFAVEPDHTAGQLTIRAIRWFEHHDMLEPGGFRLGLLRGGTIVDLAVDELLLPAGVVEGDVLHLLTAEPQVDGARPHRPTTDAKGATATIVRAA
jgi:hypothetical protein